ncbi:magnesium transporter [Raphidocelis subcapitata]|uniref:Magnesium transporter n=1 Tax=Raphidocelis subcapitata TaxID=307507 RepID=A0A2V0P8Y7_9CHLO|nr:magnesium transporter [Raphidocelis subcapitata]|eukprot:GBF94353.1 magnesium transporter [Raphidocelis subcapitata]
MIARLGGQRPQLRSRSASVACRAVEGGLKRLLWATRKAVNKRANETRKGGAGSTAGSTAHAGEPSSAAVLAPAESSGPAPPGSATRSGSSTSRGLAAALTSIDGFDGLDALDLTTPARKGGAEGAAGVGAHGGVDVGGGVDYSHVSVLGIARSRTGWLALFGAGLLFAALVVEQFEDVLEKHVELSFFVPLIMGHGGNTGSQAVTTVIRALALKQVSQRDAAKVVLKEAAAGGLMGGVIGLAILGFSCLLPGDGISTEVGATVAIALPLVSLWANGLGAALTLLADRLRLDPAVTSIPAATTVIDASGIYLYLSVARMLIGDQLST